MDRETEAYDAQYDLIASEYGEDTASKANYGWGVDGTDAELSIATKVYGPGKVLVTNIDLATGEMLHSWSDY